MRLAMVSDTDSIVARPDSLRVADSLRALMPDSFAARADTIDRDSAQARPDTVEQATEFPSEDDVYSSLRDMPGFRIVEYRGREVTLDVDGERVRLDGEAQAKYGESTLQADSISYWIGLQFINARNAITLTGEGQTVTSDAEVNYDVSQTKGTIMDARTAFNERGTEWFVRGDVTPRGTATVFVREGDFSSCELEVPHYYFKAGNIKVVTENVLVAWPVTLYINEVPVAWLPFFAQDIRPGRRSGFLPPRFGVNDIVSTSDGVGRSVTDAGYYFAINEFMDSQFTIDWFSGDFTRLNGGFRYKNLKKFFEGNLLLSYSLGDSRTLQVRANHQHEITPVTQLRVNGNFVTDTRVYEEQSFDPRLQTQRISSDLGLQHRFPFASINVSASSRQDLGTMQGNTDLTLPNIQATFTPITLFRAPRNRAGAFNNMTLSGGTSFQRQSRLQDEGDDQLNTIANANSSLRIGSFGISGRAGFDERVVTPYDSTGAEVDDTGQTRVDYSGSADYQIDLVGSTTLRPTVALNASQFQSDLTGGRYIAAPTRLQVGATLSTDVYGFFPGFGPFERIRHKVSPRFVYSYSPATEVADSLLSIPGFPVSESAAQNRLGIALNQTFEAKLREDIQLEPDEEALLEGRDLVQDSIQAVADSLAAVAA
ncbi:MAG: putative LPS assembly protein LptD, partial [Gemmatimonadota bacterium]|nr:putative LPS assembly protein LptD [Gemmatimonadota bacterium]